MALGKIAGLVKLGLGAREAFRDWRESVRAKKRARKQIDEGKSAVDADREIKEEEEHVNFIWNTIKGAVRHGLTAGGGVLVSNGLATQDEASSAVGAAMALVGFGFSVYRKYRRNKETGSAD